MPKVSVIIPVFGVEQFIERCARSLFEQTLEDMEFIFVNDCTKDKSIDILMRVIDEYPKRKEQIHILSHDTNKGIAVARQSGLVATTGEYIIHCDSDDWVEHDAYEKMYNKAKCDNADIVICNYFVTDGKKRSVHHPKMSNNLHNIIFDYIQVWTHLVRKEIYSNNIVPPCGAMFDDRVITIQLFFYAQKVVLIDEPLYYYFHNNNSICRTFSEAHCVNRFQQAVGNVDIIYSFLKKKNLIEIYKIDIVRLKYEARHQIAPVTDKKKYYSMWKKCYPEINKTMFFSRGIKMSERIRFILTYFRLFALLRK